MTENIFDSIKLQFEQFLSLVGNVLAYEKDINIIQNRLRRHFNTTSSLYLCSTDFQLLLNNIQNLFNKNDNSTKYFAQLASFDKHLRKHRIKLSGSYRSSNKVFCSTKNTESVKIAASTNDKTVFTLSQSSTINPLTPSSFTINEHNPSTLAVEQTVEKLLNSCNSILFELNECHLPIKNKESKITTDSINISECEIKRQKKITKLERRLSNLSKTIRQLEEKDMSLDEMEHCDLYVVESNCKKQAYEIHIKLAELKRQSSSVERILDQPVTLTETEIGHPLINKALEDMVNQTRFLPSFNNVLDTVEKANDKYQLNLNPDIQKNLAEKSFKIIGRKIKTRRMADFHDIMNSRLPDDFDIEQTDPALNSSEIEKVLLENKREAIIKTEKIFEEFSQIDPDLAPEVLIESSEESTIESDEDEEVASECETIIESSGNKLNEIDYDVVDILPPFSPKSSSASSPIPTEILSNKDPVEAKVEISLKNCTLTILSTASIPIQRTSSDSSMSMMQKNDSESYTVSDENNSQKSQPITIIKEHKVQTVIPRHRQPISVNETFYDIYKQRLNNDNSLIAQKRLSAKVFESTKSKKFKEQPDIVILD